MNVHSLFPGVVADPLLGKSPADVIGDVDFTKFDMMVMLTIKNVAGEWEIGIVSSQLTNAEIILALELMKINILNRMAYE